MKYNGLEFKLSDSFLAEYKNKKVKFGPLGLFVYKRTYARPLENGKTEDWWQTVQRVVEGCYLIQRLHCQSWNLPWNPRQAKKSAEQMYALMFDFKFLPPGRGLWAMGTDFMFKRGSACLQNCAFVSTKDIFYDFSAPFVWLMDMSMLGVGVGFDTLGASEREMRLKKPRTSSDICVIDDSREGWVDAFKRVLDAYAGRDTLPASFDYSQIRPAGAPIRGFGGQAPGKDPLEKLVNKTIAYLDKYVQEDSPVDSTMIVDLMNFAGEAVVAGGIRRTAELALGSLKDEEYINLKTGNKVDDPALARWASNNSLQVSVGDDYSIAESHSAINGEPGFAWLNNCRNYGRMADPLTGRDKLVMGLNPCGEQTLESYECCTLVETFPSLHESLEDYLFTLKYAYLYGKTVTLLPSHDARTNAVMFRNRRIGLSQTGIVENVNRLGFREHIRWCDAGYKEVRRWDEIYSDWLCIPRSIKITTVKPSGTVSLLPGVTPGVHFPHSEYYIRRVRVNKNSHIWKTLEKAGYKVEPDVYEKENTMVIEFPIHEAHFDRRKDQVSIWEQLELAAAMQTYWSDNSVSVTVTVRPEEAKDLPKALSMYEARLKSVSFLPLSGEKVYKQAPYEAISEQDYKGMVSKLKSYKLDVDQEDKIEEKFCDGDKCVL